MRRLTLVICFLVGAATLRADTPYPAPNSAPATWEVAYIDARNTSYYIAYTATGRKGWRPKAGEHTDKTKPHPHWEYFEFRQYQRVYSSDPNVSTAVHVWPGREWFDVKDSPTIHPPVQVMCSNDCPPDVSFLYSLKCFVGREKLVELEP
jgi:hypothetical protein